MQVLLLGPAGFAQPRPLLHTLPLQQGCPLPPQVAHVEPPSPALHASPVPQEVPFGQQDWPFPPQARQTIPPSLPPASQERPAPHAFVMPPPVLQQG
jgi:hypothetical protein